MAVLMVLNVLNQCESSSLAWVNILKTIECLRIGFQHNANSESSTA